MRSLLCVVGFFVGTSLGCGGDAQTQEGPDGGTATDAAGVFSDAPPTIALCEPTCESGDTCVDGTCCTDRQLCGDTCCGDDAVCSFGACIIPGADCYDSSECEDGEYCEPTLGEEPGELPIDCVGSTAPEPGKCLPSPPVCPEGQTPDDPSTCLVACEYMPEAAPFAPTLKYAWGSVDAPGQEDSVMMTPIVVQLDDDNCDGLINERDIPEIVFSTFGRDTGLYNTNGTLHAISIIDGQVVEKWSVDKNSTVSPIHPGRSIAGGNIDGVTGNEVVTCTSDGRVRAFAGDGSELWMSEPVSCYSPSLADIDQDGTVEVLAGSYTLDGATGVVELTVAGLGFGAMAYDVTGDGVLDFVGNGGVARANGDWVGSFLLSNGTSPGGGRLAVGDLDLDGVPEILFVEYNKHVLHVFAVDETLPGNIRLIRENIDINGAIDPARCGAGSAGNTRGGGPPTVADTNGDGFPDVALAGGVGYTVFDGLRLMTPAIENPDTILWAKETQDCSSATTGSSVFDFNGDGRAEVVYGDELMLHVYDGTTGADLFETCNTNGTLYEYPVIADVDSDGRADIVVVSNNYSGFNCEGVKTTGVRIFGDTEGDWVRTRPIWNQHSYHVTNVQADGEIPQVEPSNHLNPNLNNYRLNVQPAGEFSAPDLRVDVALDCGNDEVRVVVRNYGQASVPAGVPVAVYLNAPGDPSRLADLVTTRPLYPAEAEDFVVMLPSSVPSGTTVHAIVDEDPTVHLWQECRIDNNRSDTVPTSCGID